LFPIILNAAGLVAIVVRAAVLSFSFFAVTLRTAILKLQEHTLTVALVLFCLRAPVFIFVLVVAVAVVVIVAVVIVVVAVAAAIASSSAAYALAA